MPLFDHNNLPSFGAAIESVESSVLWAGKRGDTLARSIPFKISSTSTDSGNTPSTTLRGGLVMAMAVGGTELVPYVAGDNLEIKGILYEAVNMLQESVATDKFVSLVTGGLIRTSEIPNLDEYAKGILATMGCDFNDEGPSGAAMGDNWLTRYIVDNLTLTAAMNGTRFLVNKAGAVTLTLPTIAVGLRYQVWDLTANDVVLDGASNIAGGAALNNDKVTITDVGAGVEIFAEYVDAADTLAWMVKTLNGTAAYS